MNGHNNPNKHGTSKQSFTLLHSGIAIVLVFFRLWFFVVVWFGFFFGGGFSPLLKK